MSWIKKKNWKKNDFEISNFLSYALTKKRIYKRKQVFFSEKKSFVLEILSLKNWIGSLMGKSQLEIMNGLHHEMYTVGGSWHNTTQVDTQGKDVI